VALARAAKESVFGQGLSFTGFERASPTTSRWIRSRHLTQDLRMTALRSRRALARTTCFPKTAQREIVGVMHAILVMLVHPRQSPALRIRFPWWPVSNRAKNIGSTPETALSFGALPPLKRPKLAVKRDRQLSVQVKWYVMISNRCPFHELVGSDRAEPVMHASEFLIQRKRIQRLTEYCKQALGEIRASLDRTQCEGS
jgi:hypothetical protein